LGEELSVSVKAMNNTIRENLESKPLYPFLDIIKERDAILLGVNLSNRYLLDLFKYIERQSTPVNAGKYQLFSLKRNHTENLKVIPEDLITFLNRLVEDKLIIQIVGLEYDLDLKMIQPNSYFIAHPPAEKSVSLESVFERSVSNSITALKTWVEQRAPFSVELFKKELENQFANSKQSLKNDFTAPILNIKKLFSTKKYDVPIREDLIDFIAIELIEELNRRNISITVPNHGILILKPSEMLPHYETTVDFVNHQLIPSLRTDVKLAHSLSKINYEELDYSMGDTQKPLTTRFMVKKVTEIKSKKAKLQATPTDIYPGSLAVEIILALETPVERRYLEMWKDEALKMKEDFKEGINRISERWENLFRAMDHVEAAEYAPDVWRELVTDPEVYYTKWELENGTMHVFVGREPIVIRKLVNNMLDLPSKEFWKVLALRSIIDQNENELRKILDDDFFVSDYGSLLRRVYIHTMPWYYKGFAIFPLRILKDIFYTKAKEILHEQQERLSVENKQKLRIYLAEKEKEKTSKLHVEMENMLTSSIVEKLDQVYLVDKNIPHIGAIKNLFPEIDSKDFQEILSKRGFRTVPLGQKYSREYDILLYPIDKDWQEKKTGITNFVRQIIDKLSETFLNEADRLTLVKARKLKTFLEKTGTNAEITVVEKPKEEDPYHKLEKEIKNLKAREKRKEDEAISQESQNHN
jgi:hypothetical protein